MMCTEKICHQGKMSDLKCQTFENGIKNADVLMVHFRYLDFVVVKLILSLVEEVGTFRNLKILLFKMKKLTTNVWP